MKVGHLLSEEIKNIPSLQYPIKVVKNFKNNSINSDLSKIESHIYIDNCYFFINDINKNITKPSSSFSFRKSKSLKTKKIINEKSFDERNKTNKNLNENSRILPALKKNNSCKKNNFKKRKNSCINKNAFLKTKEPFFDFKDDTANKIQKIFNLKIERKLNVLNKITYKLNKPLFLLNNTVKSSIKGNNFKEVCENNYIKYKKF